MSKEKLKQLLTQRLGLSEPRFKLEKSGDRVYGSVISETFKGKGDHLRQRLIREAVEAELGREGLRGVGTLLAYTNDEWDVDLPAIAG